MTPLASSCRLSLLQPTVVDWSCERRRERVFERSVFAGGFILESAEAVVADDGVDPERVAALVAGLVDKSMMTAPCAVSTPCYAMLETLRPGGGST